MKIILFSMLFLFTLGLTGCTDPQKSQPTEREAFSGQELLDVVNKYRENNGVMVLEVEHELCRNLNRYYYHLMGLEREDSQTQDEWYKDNFSYWSSTGKEYGRVGLLYQTETPTASELLEDLISEPGAKGMILSEEKNVGCAFGRNGVGILILAENQPRL